MSDTKKENHRLVVDLKFHDWCTTADAVGHLAARLETMAPIKSYRVKPYMAAVREEDASDVVAALKNIARYQTPSEVSENAENQGMPDVEAWDGLDREEWLEMAYENVVITARDAIRSLKGKSNVE